MIRFFIGLVIIFGAVGADNMAREKYARLVADSDCTRQLQNSPFGKQWGGAL